MIIIPSNCAAAIPSDPYWKSVSLLVKDLGINGATNNSFYDDGPYKFLPTRSGDVTQGSFSPFGPLSGDAPPQVGGSVYLDGNGDYLTLPSTSGQLGSGDFTFEAWVYPIAKSTSMPLIWQNYTTWGSGAFAVFAGHSSDDVTKYQVACDGTFPAIKSSSNIVYNTWTHLAVVRSNGVIKLYVNGVQEGSSFTNSNALNGAGSSVIGTNISDLSNCYFNGCISNLRVVKGSAVYTAAFKPPTAPLTAITGTSLLTCQSATAITDASSNAFTVTKYGDARAVSDSPFGYGSVYFDGSGDYLSLPSNAAFGFGSGDFTMEAWFYKTGSNSVSMIIDDRISSSGGIGGLCLYVASGALKVSNSSAEVLSGGTFASNTWNHCALVRNGSTLALYLNGALVASNSSYTATLSTTSAIWVGNSGYNEYADGYVSNVRIVKGSAVYTTNFTPSTAPLTAISGTSLLTCQDKGGIVDASANSFTVTRVGDSKPVGMTPFAQKQSGYWSNYFDGTGDYLSVPDNSSLQMGTGDFTIEYWHYTSTMAPQVHISKGAFGTGGLITFMDSGGYYVNYNGSSIGPVSVARGNVWNHIAVTRSGTSMTLYVNGSAASTWTSAANLNSTASFYIGTDGSIYTSFNGYISNVRVVKGTAVYTSTFTPPTAPLTAISGTSLLTCQDNRLKDNGPNNFTITRTGDTAVSRLNPFGPTMPAPTVNLSKAGSVYMDGSGSGYLTAPANSQFLFNGDLTIEAWICPNNTNYQTIYATGGAGANDQFTIKAGSGAAEMYFCGTAGALTTTGTIPVGAWSHVAVSRSGSTVRGFINGVLVGSVTYASAVGSSSAVPRIGYRTDNVQNVNGYLSNVRVVNGTALYTASFTPSTSPLTAVSGTALLTCQDGATITDASSNGFTITKVGTTAVVSDATPFKRVSTVYGGSGYFNGTYATISDNASLRIGNNDFTIDMWVYPTTLTNGLGLFDKGANNANGIGLYTSGSGNLRIRNGGSSWFTSLNLTANAWNHVAMVRSGANTFLYLNGIGVNTSIAKINLTDTSTFSVGYVGGFEYSMYGYISNFRVVNGVALYAANFVPPVEPVSAVGGTSLLLNFDNAGIYDGSNNNELRTYGNAKVSTSGSKYGTSSYSFDGTTGSYLNLTDTASLTFGTGDFTIETWINFSSVSADKVIYDGRPASGAYPCLYTYGQQLRYYVNSAHLILVDAGLVTGQWYHIALSRSSGTTRLFLNGSQVGSSADTTNYVSSASVRIGADLNGNGLFSGYMDDYRITKGIGRYTANFTPPALEAATRMPV